jgi:hypothetical protein
MCLRVGEPKQKAPVLLKGFIYSTWIKYQEPGYSARVAENQTREVFRYVARELPR